MLPRLLPSNRILKPLRPAFWRAPQCESCYDDLLPLHLNTTVSAYLAAAQVYSDATSHVRCESRHGPKLTAEARLVCRMAVLDAVGSEQGDQGLQLFLFAEAYLDSTALTRRPHAGRQG